MDMSKFQDEYRKQLCSSFGVPTRYFEPVKYDYKASLAQIEKENISMVKYVIEWFIDGKWKEKFSDSSSTMGSAMSRGGNIQWANGPEDMKWGIDDCGYLYRIVVKKPQWTSWRRPKESKEWLEVSGHDTITEGTAKLARSGFVVIWASVNDNNECFGIDRNGNAFKIERTK